MQKEQVETSYPEVTNSINYAWRIQTTVLPSDEFVKKLLPQQFILFKPRDIVSDDFYWITKIYNNVIMAVADCTGHGMPGAFMSMLGILFLNDIVSKSEMDNTGEILNQLRKKVKTALKQTGQLKEQKDGMDIALRV